MTKIILDLTGKTRNDIVYALISGFRKILDYFGPYSEWVTCFEVGEFRDGEIVGPDIKVFFKSPFGNEGWHSSNFRFIGNGDGEPSSDDIVEHFLPIVLSELERMVSKVKEDHPDVETQVWIVQGEIEAIKKLSTNSLFS